MCFDINTPTDDEEDITFSSGGYLSMDSDEERLIESLVGSEETIQDVLDSINLRTIDEQVFDHNLSMAAILMHGMTNGEVDAVRKAVYEGRILNDSFEICYFLNDMRKLF